ncbi:MAG: putative Ig domain-containing protein [Bacteroidaceae bacterium]|nr:putative Ig domain-containing protein [Bacteroidaceae bacterium]
MKKAALLSFVLALAVLGMQAQTSPVKKAKFHLGDNLEWAQPTFNDASWQTLDITQTWSDQGIDNQENGWGWYRAHVTIPKSLLQQGESKEVIILDVPKADDAVEVFLNGTFIGKSGRFPSDNGGYSSAWSRPLSFSVKADASAIKWDADNVLAFRVYSGNEPGGLFDNPIVVRVPARTDGLTFAFKEGKDKKGDVCNVTLTNTYPLVQKGQAVLEISNPETGEVLKSVKKNVSLKEKKSLTLAVPYDRTEISSVKLTYTDAGTGKTLVRTYIPKYLLTPPAPAAPRFNTTAVYGVRPGCPVIFKFGVSGERPMKITAENLPKGLTLNPENGSLSGTIDHRATLRFTVKAENAHGTATQEFTLRVGNQIALTPPMGWNSWNCWGLSVSQEKVMSSAQAIVDKGLADYGYQYINVDDAWEAAERNPDGTIGTNDKFPDMKGLGDWLHANGLKFGIYSSPGDRTCGGYLGSLGHEKQDAETYNAWGVDYLKYDWCGYSREFDKENYHSTASYVRPYLLMQKYLRDQPRDIFYSLCQYGMANVWEWGEFVDANSWRTTGDITDTWRSMYDIGFIRQAKLQPYAKPGRWNDPDMLIVGKVGWSNNLRDSRLTPDEQYTHISLWTLLASNMLIGCDVSQIDDFTINLLCNNEVNAVNQDILGIQAKPEVIDGNIQIWVRPLADGSHAVGIFNVGTDNLKVDFRQYFNALGITRLQSVRDLWRQQDLSTSDTNYFIPSHGVKYLKVKY